MDLANRGMTSPSLSFLLFLQCLSVFAIFLVLTCLKKKQTNKLNFYGILHMASILCWHNPLYFSYILWIPLFCCSNDHLPTTKFLTHLFWQYHCRNPGIPVPLSHCLLAFLYKQYMFSLISHFQWFVILFKLFVLNLCITCLVILLYGGYHLEEQSISMARLSMFSK